MQFVRLEEVRKMLGVSRTTLWRMVQAGAFPPAVEITERNRGYLLDDVQAWMQGRVEAVSARQADIGSEETPLTGRRTPFASESRRRRR